MTEMRNIDDHHRNPNINDRDHQVGQLTNSPPTIYKSYAVNREAFSITRKASRWVLGEVHSLLCDEVDQTFKMKKREVEFGSLFES